MREGEPVSKDLPDWEPDLIIDAPEAEPVAVFLVQCEQRILEAMLLQSDAISKDAPARVAALLEREASVSQRTRIRAINRLDATAVYYTDQYQAVQHIVAAAVGRRQHAH